MLAGVLAATVAIAAVDLEFWRFERPVRVGALSGLGGAVRCGCRVLEVLEDVEFVLDARDGDADGPTRK